jgi:acetyl esterase
MHRISMLVAAAIVVVAGSVSWAQTKRAKGAGYPPSFAEAAVETYKEVGGTKLNLYIFNPQGHQPTDKRAVVVFFFGGGWTNGNPGQFQEHCKHLASRGLVAITADYRVASRHQVKAKDCVADAKSAIRYVRREAGRLGIDPSRIVAAGGSAGGHLAACTGIVEGFEEPAEDTAISSRPNALVLFNPAVVLAPIPGIKQLDRERVDSLKDRMGVEPEQLSPYHHVQKGAPPALILHGKADNTVPYSTVEAFAKAMTDAGNDCTLVGYEGQGHGFFNFGRGDGEHYKKTVQAMDEFLARLGYLAKE